MRQLTEKARWRLGLILALLILLGLAAVSSWLASKWPDPNPTRVRYLRRKGCEKIAAQCYEKCMQESRDGNQEQPSDQRGESSPGPR
jgi:hypothetical protein